MNRILVGFDGSEGAKQALNRAIAVIEEEGVLFLLAVVPTPEDRTFIDRETYKKLKSKANSLIEEVKGDIGQNDFVIKGLVEEGDPSSVIIDFSNRLDVALIVLGSKGEGELGRFLIGSVANKVVQYAHKPVMVVR